MWLLADVVVTEEWEDWGLGNCAKPSILPGVVAVVGVSNEGLDWSYAWIPGAITVVSCSRG